MPLFEIGETELVPFRKVQAGPDLYEKEIEDLLWENLELITGDTLFPIARQPVLGDGMRPDIVALDPDGNVAVIEVKRDVDRKQLAQCLEYAGWASETSLDEIARMYPEGEAQFFSDWADFTETDVPQTVQPGAKLYLVAGTTDDRTESAISFLEKNGLPVTVLTVGFFEDSQGRRFFDVDSDHEIEAVEVAVGKRKKPVVYKIDGRMIIVGDLVAADLLAEGDKLSWTRPRSGESYIATVTPNAQLRLEDGRTFASPSRAAMEAAKVPSYDGWHAWTDKHGNTLSDLRERLLQAEG